MEGIDRTFCTLLISYLWIYEQFLFALQKNKIDQSIPSISRENLKSLVLRYLGGKFQLWKPQASKT